MRRALPSPGPKFCLSGFVLLGARFLEISEDSYQLLEHWPPGLVCGHLLLALKNENF